MRFRDLGTIEIEAGGIARPPGGRKLDAILARLLIDVNQRVSVDAVIDAVWGDAAVADRTATLESHIWRLRRVLEPERGPREPASVLINDAGGYRLLARPDEVDSLRFTELGAQARDLLLDEQPARALQRCDEALQLWRGTPYQPLSDEPWASTTVARLTEFHADLSERRIAALVEVGRLTLALADLEPLLAEFPFRERLWSLRMLALYRSGRTEEALETYQRARMVLQDEVGLEPGEDLQALQARMLRQDPELAAREPAPPTRSSVIEIHLPRRPSPLIGRDDDVRRLAELMTSRLLVTLTGAAGAGKTRLGIEVARAVTPQFPDGVWFIDLTSTDSDDLVVDVISSTLELAPATVGTSLQTLVAFARNRRMLLVLDNCEHVVQGVADVVETLFAEAPECVVLATSREALSVDGEVIWTVSPLAVSPDPAGTDSPAVELFVARAAAANPEMRLGADERRFAAQICEAVDGLPLAVELAAARVRSHSLTEILAQVHSDPSRLSRIGREVADHRQTLRSAIEWSHELLSPVERELHRRLAVLPGQFSSVPAVAVGAEGELGAADVDDVLSMLVHRSMLVSTRASGPGGTTLYHQFATVRAHAQSALAAAGEVERVTQRRDAWVQDLLERRPRICNSDPTGWHDLADANYATIRATLHHLLIDVGTPAGAAIAADLGMFWFNRKLMVEGLRWLESAAEVDGVDDSTRALARAALAATLILQGRSDLARPHAVAALSDLEAVPEERLVAVGDMVAALAHAATALGEGEIAASALVAVGNLAERTGDPGLAVMGSALRCAAAEPSPQTAAVAAELFETAIAHDHQVAAGLCAAVISFEALRSQQPEVGIRWLDRGAQTAARMGSHEFAGLLELRGNFAHLAGDDSEAVRFFAAARAEMRRAGVPWPRQEITIRFMRETEDALTGTAYEQAWREGERSRVGTADGLMLEPVPAP